MDFVLLIVMTAILRIRPTDFVPGLEDAHLYEIAILSCLLVGFHKLAAELSATFAGQRPITTFVFLIFLMMILSDFANGAIDLGIESAIAFFKVILFYLLLVGIVDTPARLRRLVACLVIIDLVPTSLATLHYYGYINIPKFTALESGDSTVIDPITGDYATIRRLVATGMFGDPNDFCQILNTGLMFCVSGLLEKGAGLARGIWLAPIALLGLAVKLTGSRGGLLGTLGGLAVLFWSRYGRRKAILLATVALPVILFVLKGRMGQISATEGTGQARVQIWAEGFMALTHSSIVLGIGANRFVDVTTRATHNGFLCAFVELGVVGGAFFFGAFYYAITALCRLGSPRFVIVDPEVRRLRPYILAALVSFAINELSLTHPFTEVTYMMLGLAMVCIRLADPRFTEEGFRWNSKLLIEVMSAAAFFLIALYLFTQFSLRY